MDNVEEERVEDMKEERVGAAEAENLQEPQRKQAEEEAAWRRDVAEETEEERTKAAALIQQNSR